MLQCVAVRGICVMVPAFHAYLMTFPAAASAALTSPIVVRP